MQNLSKLRSMEGIRGIAAFIVLLSHLKWALFLDIEDRFQSFLTEYFPYSFSMALSYVFRAMFDGNFSVWLFWVMSGFVLSMGYFKRSTNNLSSALDVRNYLLASSIKRYFRLVVPVFISVLFAYLLLKNDLMTNKLLAEKLGVTYSPGWLGGFYTFDASIFDAIKSAMWNAFFNNSNLAGYNGVVWTMEPEFYGSLFVFAFLGLAGHSKIRYFIYPIIVMAVYLLRLHWLNSFVLGIVLCDLYMTTGSYKVSGMLMQNKFITYMVVLLFLLLIGMPNYSGIFHLILAVSSVFCIISSHRMNAFFSSKIPVFLGKISFSLYLVHLPILCSITGSLYLFLEKISNHIVAVTISSILTILLSLTLAIILNRIGDEQGINLGRKISSMVIKFGNKKL